MTGRVTRVVRNFRSTWGYISPDDVGRTLYFNQASLARPEEFALIAEGQQVEFDEIPDPVNGTRATSVVMTVLPGEGVTRAQAD